MNDIYYVEDDESISQTVKEFLGQHGYSVFVYTTIEAAKKAFGSACPMLALLDWNMPDGSGRELSRWIRSKWKELPVILLTVRGDSRDIVSGFQSGADDYVVKPFELEVLLLRIEALLRRCGDVSRQYLSCGGISLDQKRMLVFSEGDEVDLSPSEYQLLLYLLQNKGIIVTRKQLLERVWDNSGNFVNDNTLTVTVKRLREKLGEQSRRFLKTVRGIGYQMEDCGD